MCTYVINEQSITKQVFPITNRNVNIKNKGQYLVPEPLINKCNRTRGPFLILGSGGGWRLPRRDTHTGINNISSLPHVVFLSMSSSSRCVQNHYNRPTLVSRKVFSPSLLSLSLSLSL